MAAITTGVLDARLVRAADAGPCDCPGTPETQTCPMHRPAPRAPGGGQCAMRHATPPASVIAVATGFTVAPLLQLSEAPRMSTALPPVQVLVHDRSDRPEEKPPRA